MYQDGKILLKATSRKEWLGWGGNNAIYAKRDYGNLWCHVHKTTDPWQETKRKYTKKRKEGPLFKMFSAGSPDRFACICHLFYFPSGFFLFVCFLTKENHILEYSCLLGGPLAHLVGTKDGWQHPFFHVVFCCVCVATQQKLLLFH